MNTTDPHDSTHSSRPFGFWLTAVDRLMAAEFAAALADDGITRGDWRLLNVIAGTTPGDTVPADAAADSFPAHAAPAAGSLHADAGFTEFRLCRLIERGWVAREGDGWTLTDAGRAARERLGTAVDGIRAKVADAVPAADMTTTLASLEAIARALGWDENTPLPRRNGRADRRAEHPHQDEDRFGRRFARIIERGMRHGRGFGHRHEHDDGLGHRHEHDDGLGQECGHSHGHAHGHRQQRGSALGFDHRHSHRHHGHPYPAVHFAEQAFERGFDAGFDAGRKRSHADG